MFLLSSSVLYAASDPDWLVNITINSSGEKLSGAGYIVQVGDQYYIRTASHVTLGSDTGSFISGKKEKLKVIVGKSIIDSAHDDQLIPIEKPKKSKSIAFYSPSIKNFVVWPERSAEIKKNKRNKYVEQGFNAAFYVVPNSVKSKTRDRKFRVLKGSIHTDYSPSYNYSNTLRTVKGETSLTADIKVIPGESGSPLFKDILVGYNIQDANGKHYEYPLPNMSGGATILLGHVQSFQRFVDRSNFTSSKQSENIIDKLNNPSKYENDNVKWGRYKGIYYRYKKTEKGLIQELNNTKDLSGTGTGGNGGTGTGGNGGTGTGGNGGTGTGGNGGTGTGGNGGTGTGGNGGTGTGGNGGGSGCEECTGSVKMGMIYHGKAVTAFKVKEYKKSKLVKEYTLYADWENYQYLEDKVKNSTETIKYEAVELTGDNLAKIIKEKADRNKTYQSLNSGYMRSSRCVIDGEALLYNHLNINIQPFEVISIPLDEKFFPIVDVKSKDDGEIYKLDVRGLFSVDAFEFTESFRNSEFEHFQDHSYVMIRADGYQHSRNSCKLEKGLSRGIRSRLFRGGKLEDDKFELPVPTGSKASKPVEVIKESKPEIKK